MRRMRMIQGMLFAGICLLIFSLNPVAAAETADQLVLYVSLEGNDAWSGKLPAANDDKSDGPFRTLVGARDEIRKIKGEGRLPAKGALVLVRGGSYYLDSTFELTSEDSGSETGRIIYAAFPGEETRLSGGKPVTEFERVTDPATLEKMDETARVRVSQADLKKHGITDFGPVDGGGLEVFHEDMPMTLSRWPNEGFVRIKDLVVEDGHQIHGVKGSLTGKFTYEEDRPERWVGEKDPWLHGYWFWDWSDQRQPLESIDTEKKILSVKQPYHNYGYRKGQWYYAFNLLSEVDSPGEYYVDREAGILYFWPPTSLGSNSVVVSNLKDLVNIKDASYVTITGFILEMARETGITISGGAHNQLDHCIIRNLGGQGASISGESHEIYGCEVYQTGKGGISISGGDRATLKPGNITAQNNHVHHYGRVARMYQPGFAVNGVGNHLANNLIHSAPHIGIMFWGNEHVFEYNEIHHVCFESNDAGAIYAGRDWTMRGNIIRHNYMHDVTGFENRGCVGVYLDDMFASADILGNVFHKVTAAAFIGGGRDCKVENNVFIDCDPALHVDARAMGWAGYHADEWIKEASEKSTLLGLHYKEEPYASRYPQLPNILNDEPKAPKGNTIARNICMGGKWDRIEDKARPYLNMTDNLLGEDPRFRDAANHDWSLKEDSPAYKLGFKDIPFEKIGLHKGGIASSPEAESSLKTYITALTKAPGSKGYTLHALARRLKSDCNYARADECYKTLLDHPGFPDINKIEIVMESGNMLVESGDYATARGRFERIAADEQAPIEARSLAHLQIAKTFRHAKQYPQSVAALEKVKEIPQALPQHIWEAERLIAEANRISQGLTPRDENASRATLPAWPLPGATLHVSLSGTDAGSGAADQPFATLQRAIDEAGALLRKGISGGVSIAINEGVYPLSAGLTIDASIASSEKSPLVIAAAEGKPVRFMGGVKIEGFTPVIDPAILERLPEESRSHVIQANLKDQGITQYGHLETRGFGVTNARNTSLELFMNGKPMTPAMWPNEDFVRTGSVLSAGKSGEGQTGRFVFNNPRIQRWKKAVDVMLYGYWYYDWADCIVGLKSIDFEKDEIETAHGTNYGFKEGQPFRVFNLLEEIDEPGEWHLDRPSGILYFYPPEDLAQATVEISMLEDPMLSISHASFVGLKGITFDLGRGNGIVLTNATNCRILDCEVSRFGATGITVGNGRNDAILACDIHTLGRGGIAISGGDRLTLEPSGHIVENCDIHHFSRIDRTYTPALQMDGAGIRIAHNRIHDTPCHGLRIEGNDHVVEYNEVYDVVLESDDQGGIDMFYNPTYRGNIFRYNYFHDIGNGEACGQAGIRLDDAISGTLIYGNIFNRCSEANFGGVQIHGGKDNWVENNLFVDCRFGISLSQWSVERWPEFLNNPPVSGFLETVKIKEPSYSERYPDLARIYDQPYVNRIWRNIAVNSVKFIVRDGIKQNTFDNVVTRIDPGFKDMASDDLAFLPGASGASASSFSPIPFSEIGLYTDELRPELPE